MDVLFDEAAADPPVGRSRTRRPLGAPPATRSSAPRRCSRRRRAARDRRRVRRVVGRRSRRPRPARDRARRAGVPQRLGRGALPPGHPLALPARARGGARRGRRRARRSAATLDFRLRYGRVRRRRARPRARAIRASWAATACPTWRSPATAGLRSKRSPRRVPARSSTTPTGSRRFRAAEHGVVDGARARARVRRRPRCTTTVSAAELDRVLPGRRGRDRRRRRRRGGGLARAPRPASPGHWLDPGPFGCLGVGPGYALGVGDAPALGGPIVVVLGDGAFGLNGDGLRHARRASGSRPSSSIGNDGAWGEIRIPQVGIYGAEGEVATRLAPSRYDRLTEVVRRARRARRAAGRAPARARARARVRRDRDRERHARSRRDGRARLPRHVRTSLASMPDPRPASRCGGAPRPLRRQDEPLPDRDRGRSQVVAMLELPDRLARVPAVAPTRRSTRACRPAARRTCRAGPDASESWAKSAHSARTVRASRVMRTSVRVANMCSPL